MAVFTTMGVSCHQIPTKQRLARYLEFSSSRYFVGGTRLVILNLLALLLILSNNIFGAVGVEFTFNGFSSGSDLFTVPESNWEYYLNDSCYYLPYNLDKSVGRILYPEAVQMRDPGATAVKSFSTSFIFQILSDEVAVGKGSGLAFIMVPSNSVLGAPNDFLGFLTTTTSLTVKDAASDDHSFGVEFDTYLNEEFGDRNDNHVGVDLASMNSTVSAVPTIPLTTLTVDEYLQVWINYVQADEILDIYIARYGFGKPVDPLVSAPVDLSLLSDLSFVGFSAAVGLEGRDQHIIMAWSFSTEGDAPPIYIAKDAPPGASPPPPGLRSPPALRSPPPPKSQPPPSNSPPGTPGSAPAPESPRHQKWV